MNETREQILNYIKQYRQEHDGLSPTYSQIGEGVGRSKSTVNYNVTQLLLDGKLKRDGRFRALVPVGVDCD